MDTTASFGYWVRRRRKALDLTQEALARAVGCATVTLRKIEADERRPSPQMAERLARCLGLSSAERVEFMAAALGERAAARLRLAAAPARRPRTNLPAPVNALIGRDAELAALTECLRRRDVRLVTLTGPVGVGKTRLAIEAGHRLLDDFRDGVHLVALASIQDPALAPTAIASGLGIQEARDSGPLEALRDHLEARELLLICDEFEHLLPAAPFLAALLAGCPGLRVLVTSRVRLKLYGEHEFVVSPLAAADGGDPGDLAQVPAVRLFCERARAARPDFRLTPALRPVVGEICRRLDGLPLAIELAAARLRLFSPQELLRRLERPLPWLTEDTSDLPPRLRGLENAIAWSYNLLTPTQRCLLDRLAVCAGGFTLATAEALCADPEEAAGPADGSVPLLPRPEVVAGVDALLAHSLLRREDAPSERRFGVENACPSCPRRQLHTATQAETRFAMLETIREFALARLAADGELGLMRRRHAGHFAAWAAAAAAQLSGRDQAIWLERFEAESDNLRAALAWFLAAGETTAAAELACNLEEFWQRRGHYSEGRRWLEQVLAQMAGRSVPAHVRGRTLRAAAVLAYRQGEQAQACSWLAESLALLRAAGDRSGEAHVLCDLGRIAMDQGRWADAVRLSTEGLAVARPLDDPCAIHCALTNLGRARLCCGEGEAAAALFAEAHGLAVHMGDTRGIAVSLANLAWIALGRRELERSTALAQEGLRLCHLLGERETLAECLEVLALAAAAAGDLRRGWALRGGAEALWAALHVVRPATHVLAASTDLCGDLDARLAGSDGQAARSQGRRSGVDAVVALALGCRHAAGEMAAGS